MNITALRHYWFALSGAIVTLSLACTLIFGLNLGLDFTGGARWDIQFPAETPVTNTDLQTTIESQDFITQDVQVQASDNNTFLITIEDTTDANIQTVSNVIEANHGSFETTTYRKVDATIGQSFKQKALYAIITALIGIILFVAWAFKSVPAAINPWRFGSVAIVALFHDIIIVLGIFTVLGFFLDVELDLAFITALLATLGFSVNDTIVILDRVRENIRSQKPHETFTDTVERSVQQTLMRSVNTSISTLFPLIALLIFGANAIFFFVLALSLGILIGTYSSIFLAAPLLAEWKIQADKR